MEYILFGALMLLIGVFVLLTEPTEADLESAKKNARENPQDPNPL